MSTDTQVNTPVQDEEVVDFASAKVKRMPGLACIGFINEVAECKEASSGNYLNVPISIKGNNGSRGTRINFLFRPDWFIPGFDPESLNDIEETNDDGKPLGPIFYGQYRRYISSESSDTPSVLKGLCGSEDQYKAFLRKWNALYKSAVAERGAADVEGNVTTLTGEEIRDLLKSFFLDDCEPGFIVAYELKQGSEKTGQSDENGKAVYRNTDRYEVDCVKWYDESLHKAWVRRASSAAKTAERMGPSAVPSFRLGFSEE